MSETDSRIAEMLQLLKAMTPDQRDAIFRMIREFSEKVRAPSE